MGDFNQNYREDFSTNPEVDKLACQADVIFEQAKVEQAIIQPDVYRERIGYAVLNNTLPNNCDAVSHFQATIPNKVKLAERAREQQSIEYYRAAGRNVIGLRKSVAA